MTSSQHGPYALGYTHPTMANNNGLQHGDMKLIPEISPQFRSESATRLREVGIASNRESAGRGEYVLGSCTQNKCATGSLVSKVVKIHPCSQKKLAGTILVTDVLEGLRQKAA